MTTFLITPGSSPAAVSCGPEGTSSTVTNSGGDPIYYRNQRIVTATVNDGSLSSGASVTLSGTQWFFVPSTSARSGTLLVTTGAPDGYLTASGMLAETVDTWACSTGVAPNVGRTILLKVMVPRTITVNAINVYVAVGGTGLTTGQNLAGLYDSTGAQIGTVADQTTAWATTGVKTMSLVAPPAVITGSATAFAWIMMLANAATTAPSFLRATTLATDALTAVTTAATARTGFVATGQTALPASFTPASTTITAASGFAIWAGLS